MHLANEMLDQLLPLYRKQLHMSNLEFMSVSGVTHLIEVFQLNLIFGMISVHKFLLAICMQLLIY